MCLVFKDIKACCSDATRAMIDYIPAEELKQAIILQIDEDGLFNKEQEFLGKISDKWIEKIYRLKEKSIEALPADENAKMKSSNHQIKKSPNNNRRD